MPDLIRHSLNEVSGYRTKSGMTLSLEMAYYENLPIYQKALALCVYLEKVVCHFSRYHKFAVILAYAVIQKE